MCESGSNENNKPVCHFCNEVIPQDVKYVSHNGFNICANCLKMCKKIMSSPLYYAQNPLRKRKKDVFNCSFCSRNTREVDTLFAYSENYICNGCVGVCLKVLRKKATTFEQEYEKAIKGLPEKYKPKDEEEDFVFDTKKLFKRFNRYKKRRLKEIEKELKKNKRIGTNTPFRCEDTR